jgi:tetratricopeptide (TPR) repeat protein
MRLQADLPRRLARLSRRGLALALWGERGIGKSHTLQALRRAIPCRSFTLEAAALPGALAALLPRPPHLPQWVRHCAEHLERGEPLPAEDWAEALGEWLAALRCTEPIPVVLGLEDLHRASPEVLEGVLALARRSRTPGTALLVTGLTPLPAPFENHRLEPMGWEESQDFLQADLGEPLPPEALEWIYLRSTGNPLFMREYRRHLTVQGYLWHNGRFWRWREPPPGRSPTTLTALAQQVVGQALRTPLLQRALGAGACLGEAPSDGLWAWVAGLSPEALRIARQSLEAWGLLEGAAFTHPLYRETCLELLSPAQQRQYLQEIPQESIRRPTTVPLLPGLRQQHAELLRQAEGLEQAGRYRELEGLLEQAVQSAGRLGQGRAVAEAWARLGALRIELGKYPQAQEALEAARDLLRRGDPHPLLARCRALLSRLHRERDLPEGRLPALRAARAALTLARSLAHPPTLVLCLSEAALTEAWAGHAPRALALAQEALSLAQTPDERQSAHGSLGQVLVSAGQLRAARVALQKALELAPTPSARHRLGLEFEHLTGGLEPARRRLRELQQLGLHGVARRLERYFPELVSPPVAPSTPCPPASPCLEVLGPVQLSGRPIAGVKRQELLLHLLEARLLGRLELSREELRKALYPHTEEPLALVLLEDLVDRTRGSLGPEVVVQSAQGYALGTIASDAERFLQSGHTGLWRGVYRQDLPGGLAQVRECLYSRLYRQACALLESNPLESARLGRILLEAQPYDPKALTLRLRLLQATRLPNLSPRGLQAAH